MSRVPPPSSMHTGVWGTQIRFTNEIFTIADPSVIKQFYTRCNYIHMLLVRAWLVSLIQHKQEKNNTLKVIEFCLQKRVFSGTMKVFTRIEPSWLRSHALCR